MREVIGVDMYNQVITGKIAKTFTAGRVDTHNIPCVVIGLDLYNQCTTGEVSKTINAVKSDSDHTPCVLIAGEEDEND